MVTDPVRCVVGVHAVQEALGSGGASVREILVQEGRRSPRVAAILERARGLQIPVRRSPRPALDRLAGGAVHQGVIALAGASRLSTEEEILQSAGDPAFLLVLDRVEDPRNLGAVVRSAAAAGVHGIFLPGRGSAGLGPAAYKAAAGALERVPLARSGNVPSLLTRLRKRGICCLGLDSEGDSLWGGFDLGLPLALVIGGEGRGLRRLVRERCDLLLGIPMPGGGGALNLSVAAALALFEVVRCRGGGAPGRARGD